MSRVLDSRTQILLQEYIVELQKIYGEHLQKIILYGSRARRFPRGLGLRHHDSDRSG